MTKTRSCFQPPEAMETRIFELPEWFKREPGWWIDDWLKWIRQIRTPVPRLMPNWPIPSAIAAPIDQASIMRLWTVGFEFQKALFDVQQKYIAQWMSAGASVSK